VLRAALKYRTQKSRQKSPSGHHRTTLSGYVFASKAHRQSAEIGLPVWGTPANFNCRLSRLGSVTAQQSRSGGQPNLAALNRGRHLCSAGRPSRWAFAHILVSLLYFYIFFSYRRLFSAVAYWMSTIGDRSFSASGSSTVERPGFGGRDSPLILSDDL